MQEVRNSVQGSEVARLVQQIEEESDAAWRAMYGPRHVGSHEIITARMEHMYDTFNELKEQVGEPMAVQVLEATMNRQADQ